MRCAVRPSSLVLAALLPLAAACREDAITAPGALGSVPGAEAAPAHGPVTVAGVLDLGVPAEGGPYFAAGAVAVTERGQVAVSAARAPGPVPFLWESGALRPLITPAGPPNPPAVVAALNAAGVGAGFVQTPATPGGPPARTHAALFTAGAPALLPDGPGEVLQSRANGINDAGDAVGLRLLRTAPGAPTLVQRATLWRRGTGEVIDLGGLGPTVSSEALAVNNRGQAVGTSFSPLGGFAFPVFFAEGRVIQLPLPPRYIGGAATAVNERGQAAGWVTGIAGPTTPTRAVLWDHGGRVDLLEVPAAAGVSIAQGINDAGDIVGFVSVGGNPNGPPEREDAALWRGGALTVLPPLSVGPIGGDGPASSASARDVNNRGEAVGRSSSAAGERAVRWTVTPALPVPDDPEGPNRAPAVMHLRPDPAEGPYRLAANACGGRFTVCVRFTVTDADGDADAPFRVTVDWGDGTPWTPNELTRSGVPALAAHDYRAPGTYTVRVTATDRRGAASTATLALAVVP